MCNYCCKFIDDPEVQKKIHCPHFFGENSPNMVSDDLISTLESGPKTYFENTSVEEKNRGMISALTNKIAAQQGALKLATALEHQNNIRKKYSSIESIIEHPICCGYLMKYCENQHNSESLSIVNDIDEYRELFSGDGDSWMEDWRDLDVATKINDSDNIDINLLNGVVWNSTAIESEVIEKINGIVMKYFNKDSITEVCISDVIVKRTMKRIKLLNLYGPSIFEEAYTDPIITLRKDVLPRFRVSDIVDVMVVCVAACEPPPLAAELYVPVPGNLLLQMATVEALSETRLFTLDEVIGCGHLYTGFLQYLEEKKSSGVNSLLCVRKIDIFQELSKVEGSKEAADEAILIFRYFVVDGAAFHVVLPVHVKRKIMSQLAGPKSDMFTFVKSAALLLLKKEFELFKHTHVYLCYGEDMKDLKVKSDLETKSEKLRNLAKNSKKTQN